MLVLALKSLWSRRLTAGLTLLAIAISVCLLLGVATVKNQAKESFARTISGTDLIVGARSGSLNLLLYSIFHLGDATNNIGWESYSALKKKPGVAWTIPLALGDSHHGYRVVGTSDALFEHYQYGDHHPLAFTQGRPFQQPFDAVLGAEVAQKLGYQLHAPVVIAHGSGKRSFTKHDNLPFQVSGILAATGTPIDRSVLIPLAGIEAIHLGWDTGRQDKQVTATEALTRDLTPKSITAALVGLKSKILTFALQREINTYPDEPLQAILPGVALRELWSLMSMAEQALSLVSGFVVLAGLVGMLTTLLAGLNERRRELAILRSLGAGPRQLFLLLALEALLLVTLGIVAGLTLLYMSLLLVAPWLQSQYGLTLQLHGLGAEEFILLASVWIAGLLLGLLPAWRAFRYSLHDGMTPRS